MLAVKCFIRVKTNKKTNIYCRTKQRREKDMQRKTNGKNKGFNVDTKKFRTGNTTTSTTLTEINV